jgi:glycosyltransferase involved in cell wall biosynthesis
VFENGEKMVQLAKQSLSATASLTRKAKIAAVIPCLNTENTIGEVVRRTKEYVNEVIVVDDGSSDMTAIVAQYAGAMVIRHDHNQGKGAAMKTGAANIKADILVFIDGDGQHDPDNIPALLRPILEGKADFVIGSRFLRGSRASYVPIGRKTTNILASMIISFIVSVLQPVIAKISRKTISRLEPSHSFLLDPRNVRRSAERNKARTHYHNKRIRETRRCDYRLINRRLKWITDCTSGFTALRMENWRTLNLTADGYQIETEMIFEQAKHGYTISETAISCNWKGSLSRLSIVQDGTKTLLLLAKKLLTHEKNSHRKTFCENNELVKRPAPSMKPQVRRRVLHAK